MAEIMTDKGLSIAVLLNWLFTLLMALITPFLAVYGGYFIALGLFCALVSLADNLIERIFLFIHFERDKGFDRGRSC